MRFVLVFIALWGVVSAASAETRVITVTGQGMKEFVPDMAVITLGVSHQRQTARDAVSEVAVTSGAIMNGLRELGVEARDMQTSNMSLSQVWERGSSENMPRVSGYEASNLVTVRVKDLAILGDLLGHVTAQGANRFQGLEFTVQNRKHHIEEARRRAIADARARAELYAEAAGVALGALLEIREPGNVSTHPIPMARENFVSSAARPIAEGELSLSASITMVYAIETSD